MSADRLEELAAGIAAGGLDRKERNEFQKLLRSASPLEKSEVASVLNTGALVSLCLPRIQPPQGLLKKLMPQIIKDSQPAESPAPFEGLKFVWDSEASGWLPLAIPGAYLRVLSVDDEKDYAVVLGKLNPGASYPPHVHLGPEEIYVLTGDLFIGDAKLSAGDFHTAMKGSRHDINRSEQGCTILVILSKKDLQLQFKVG